MKGFVKRCVSYRNGASAAVYFDFDNRKRKKKSLGLASASAAPWPVPALDRLPGVRLRHVQDSVKGRGRQVQGLLTLIFLGLKMR